MSNRSLFAPQDTFLHRHIAPSPQEVEDMLKSLGLDSLDALADKVIPKSIRMEQDLALGGPRGEHELLQELRQMANQNKVYRSYIGMGYYGCITPPVIQRNILENPGWYTQYTPYQAEISQGRMEALLNFQTMTSDLTGLPLSNASLLDEATAAAEAMSLAYNVARQKKKDFFIAEDCHPQTLAVVQTRAEPIGINVHVGDPQTFDFSSLNLFGVLVQYPNTEGLVHDYTEVMERTHKAGALGIFSADLLALTVLKAPGEFGADIAIGSTQRFGIPMGFGGPHAAYMSVKDKFKRQMPGRLIGVSKDRKGRMGYRLTLQTREQHIRRDRATSNICTAQALLAIMASMYAVYHGPDGLRAIASAVHGKTKLLALGLSKLGIPVAEGTFFDTLKLNLDEGATQKAMAAALQKQINLRAFEGGGIGISLDETVTQQDIEDLLDVFNDADTLPFSIASLEAESSTDFGAFTRESEYLDHPVFHSYQAEHEMLRYLTRLQSRDLSLNTSMIPLGSCTMKLNATSEMLPVTWPEFALLHPFVPAEQSKGYSQLFETLESWLAEITGFTAASLQPNAGSQGEYAGLLSIRQYHLANDSAHRNICLIPVSAHGTNPASAVMAGMKVVTVSCNERGDIDVADLEKKADQHVDNLGALMITYPSTHGVFEDAVKRVCEIIHERGGLVYMDGANMNAQVGLCRPGDIGADVCHLNLHKTFCIPHGGGGPGMGPIAVNDKLAPYLPGHPVTGLGGETAHGPISAAPYGSPSILPVSWVYIALMGAEGLKQASQVAILNANYMANKLKDHFNLLYTGNEGLVAHEFILDMRPFKHSAGIEVADIAKRLMDYGFHAPTMSWPVPGTLMIEPTESESKAELDRFCDAMISIRQEIQAVIDGKIDKDDNPLKNAPHTMDDVVSTEWPHPYTREQAAFPASWLKQHKFWPAVGRVDDAYGDRNLMCTCPPLSSYEEA